MQTISKSVEREYHENPYWTGNFQRDESGNRTIRMKFVRLSFVRLFLQKKRVNLNLKDDDEESPEPAFAGTGDSYLGTFLQPLYLFYSL